MKTIVVPTDFSQPANDAALYAINIAKYIKSNLTICHAFMMPAEVTVAGQIAWPAYTYEEMIRDNEELLDKCSKMLIQEEKSLNFPNSFHPSIDYTTKSSEVIDLITQVTFHKQAVLVIAGMSGTGAATKFFTGSTSKALIEKAIFPVLLIPAGCNFKPVNKIAFATDLNPADIEVIHALGRFARYFDAELVVVHVDNDPDKYDTKKADTFLNEITSKINYDKVYYREITGYTANDGLQWLSEHGWIDMLVMVHRQSSFMDRLLKNSFTKQQANNIKIPLLVLPEGITPVF